MGLKPSQTRRIFVTSITGSVLALPLVSFAADYDSAFEMHNRDRRNNQKALIREDYWYMTGNTPPQLLTAPLKGDDPQWNAFGTCTTDGNTNSCTYVSLSQRIPAYSKYGGSIAAGAREYQQLGSMLQQLQQQPNNEQAWQQALAYVETEPGSVPPPLVDAELKMILLATALLTSPNFPIPSRQLLVARFYANECHYASEELVEALGSRNLERATAAYHLGKDAWNSYFQIVNTSISPKVGDKFTAIA